jgi:hypothetical protein
MFVFFPSLFGKAVETIMKPESLLPSGVELSPGPEFKRGKPVCDHDHPELYKSNFILCYCDRILPGRTVPVTHARHAELCPLLKGKKK